MGDTNLWSDGFPVADHRLDITLDVCPMTFVKTKLELEEMEAGAVLEVLLRGGEPLANVTRSCEEEGHAVLAREQVGENRWRIWIRNAPIH